MPARGETVGGVGGRIAWARAAARFSGAPGSSPVQFVENQRPSHRSYFGCSHGRESTRRGIERKTFMKSSVRVIRYVPRQPCRYVYRQNSSPVRGVRFSRNAVPLTLPIRRRAQYFFPRGRRSIERVRRIV